ncbi:MAG: type III-B CRISPR module RAMP protein Cmr1 [Aquificaceae bacterium]|nr:type III-B CRISPR module RAMP protein Cmr1 [Aquificaceae bacterium]
MRKLTFELEFITPAFIGGAEPGSAELRPASFVGLLRWWWRVILATFVSEVEKIYKYESLLFGSQSKAGSAWLRMRALDTKVQIERLEGTVYMIGQGARGKEYIKPGTRFTLEILCPEEYEELLSSLTELAVTLGGIGYRGRKGLGSMQVVGKDGVNLNLLKPEYWGEKIKNMGITQEGTNTLLPNLKNLTILKYDYKVDPKSWEDALQNLGRVYRDIRLDGDRTYEYKSFISNFLRGDRINPQNVRLRSLPLGLPIMYQSRSLHRVETVGNRRREIKAQAQLTWKKDREDKEQDRRRASSIMFNIKRDGFYALAFRCAFLPEGASLRLQAKGKYWDRNPSGKPKDFYISWDVWNRMYEAMFQQIIEELKRKGFREVLP